MSMLLHKPALEVLGVFIASTARTMHGYALMTETGLGCGQVYPVLRALEEAGILRSVNEKGTCESLGRKPRKTYSLTETGVRLLRLLPPSSATQP